MNTRKFEWKVFRWFVLAGLIIGVVMTRLHLGYVGFGISGGKAMYGFPISVPLIPPPNIVESLVVFVPNALVWALVLYFIYRLGKWTKSKLARGS